MKGSWKAGCPHPGHRELQMEGRAKVFCSGGKAAGVPAFCTGAPSHPSMGEEQPRKEQEEGPRRFYLKSLGRGAWNPVLCQ